MPVGTAFAWHEREGAIQRLTPPWAPMTLVSRRGKGVEKGVNVCFRLRLFGLPVIWEAEHIDMKKIAFLLTVRSGDLFQSGFTHTALYRTAIMPVSWRIISSGSCPLVY